MLRCYAMLDVQKASLLIYALLMIMLDCYNNKWNDGLLGCYTTKWNDGLLGCSNNKWNDEYTKCLTDNWWTMNTFLCT